MTVVIDASVAVMWFVPEAYTHNANRLLGPGYDLIAPDLVTLEVASALLKALRRKAVDDQHAADSLRGLPSTPIRTFPASDYLSVAFQMARLHGGSLYDAIYISLARALDAPIVTNDARLAEVARASRVQVSMIADDPPRP